MELYATEGWLQVFLVTGLIGGGTAWLTGRAIALTWRPTWHFFAYTLILGAAVRFVHFALFEADLLSIPSYAVDAAYLCLVAGLAWRITRTTQMTHQYYWLYERTSPLTWRERVASKGS